MDEFTIILIIFAVWGLIVLIGVILACLWDMDISDGLMAVFVYLGMIICSPILLPYLFIMEIVDRVKETRDSEQE